MALGYTFVRDLRGGESTFMKHFRYFASFLAAAPLWAGVHMKMEMVDLKTNEVTQMDMMLDATRMRVNTTSKSGDTSMMFLTDGGRNRMVILDKKRNEYREMDQQTMDQMTQQMQGAMSQMQAAMDKMTPEQRAMMEKMKGRMGQMAASAAPSVRTTYTAAGSGSANGFSCTKYNGMRGAEKVSEVCAAKPTELHFTLADFAIADKMRDFFAPLTSGMANNPFAGASRAMTGGLGENGIDGFPVHSTSFTNGQPTETTDLKLVERGTFSDADFSLGNAKKVEMMPMGRRSAQ